MSVFNEMVSLAPKNYNGRAKEFIKDFYEIDPSSRTGLRWKQDRFRAKKGQEAGSHSESAGYFLVSDGYYGKLYAHQAIMFLATGKMSNRQNQIDHINGNPLDNRLENLRFVSATGNQRNANRKMQSNNTSGITGLHKVFMHGKLRWRAKYAGAVLYTGLNKDFAIKQLEEARANDPQYISN